MILNLEKIYSIAEDEFAEFISNSILTHPAELLLFISALTEQQIKELSISDYAIIFEMYRRRLDALEGVPTHAGQWTFPTPTYENIGSIVYSQIDTKFYVSKGHSWVEMS